MKVSVRISTGGVTHMLKHSGMTLCGKHFHSGNKGNWNDKVTCKSCIKAEYRLRQHIASGPCHELCEVHPKPEVAWIPTNMDDDSSFLSRIVKEGVMVSTPATWRSKHKGSKARRILSHA